jgi:hypothetical protein
LVVFREVRSHVYIQVGLGRHAVSCNAYQALAAGGVVRQDFAIAASTVGVTALKGAGIVIIAIDRSIVEADSTLTHGGQAGVFAAGRTVIENRVITGGGAGVPGTVRAEVSILTGFPNANGRYG